MDFLDPKKRRAYNIRLIIGYCLMAVVIGLGTVIIVYGANGYGINTKTGQIVQNGLLFADSKPSGASIFLNGKDQKTTTSARLILAAGNYNLTLKKTGYLDWSRDFTLNEQSVARYVYPFLYPSKPVATSLKNYISQPKLITQSPDRKWLLAESNEQSTQTVVFDQYDTTTIDSNNPAVSSISIPAGILSNYSAESELTEIEWSTDNAHVILQHTYPGGKEFIIFNRDQPEQSLNINKLFSMAPDQVSLRDKKIDQLYLYKPDGTLQLGDTANSSVGPAFLKNVLAYKPYGKDIVSYVTNAEVSTGKVSARIWDNGKTYKIYEFTAGNIYLIDAAEFQSHFYFIAGSDTSDRINIYRDPLNSLRDPANAKALPMVALHNLGATKMKFSNNARFIGVESGQHFAVYDFETFTSYQYTIEESLSDNMDWMDGHRFIGSSGGNAVVMDYDGTNKHILTPSLISAGGFFSREYNNLLTITSDGGTGFTLKDVDMRAGPDLPKNKQQT